MRRWITMAIVVLVAIPLGIVWSGLAAQPAPADVGMRGASRTR